MKIAVQKIGTSKKTNSYAVIDYSGKFPVLIKEHAAAEDANYHAASIAGIKDIPYSEIEFLQ